MALCRNDLIVPQLRSETFAVPELGGEVLVRRLALRDTIALKRGVDEAPGDDEDPILWGCALLAKCVYLEDGQPALDAAQWEIFFLNHRERFWQLFDLAARLSGYSVEEAAKK